MTNFNRVIVALDFSVKDEQVLRFAKFITAVFHTRKIYFLHLATSFSEPDQFDLEFHRLTGPDSPADEKLQLKLADHIQEFFSDRAGLELQIEVAEGKPEKKLAHWVDFKAADLLIVGKKKEPDYTRLTARRLARQIKSAICFVSDHPITQLKKILVPMDFSDPSFRALQSALTFKQLRPEIEITCLHVVLFPNTEEETRKGKEKIINWLQENAQKELLDLGSSNEIDENLFEFVAIQNLHVDVAKHIREYADEQDANLIVIGAKGHSPIEYIFYGSTTESLVASEYETPVLVMR